MSKIVLGTANFGNNYGVANKGKLLSAEEAKSLIKWAQSNGINHFDTALSYEASSDILSKYLDQSLGPDLDTKLGGESCRSSKMIVRTANEIREKLGVSQLSVLYLHDEEILQSSSARVVSIGLKEVLNLGIAKKIGVSVYSEEALLACKKALPELTVFQVPENICDRRLFFSSAISNLADEGNFFMVRSIFLQGLLLMTPNLIPPKLKLAEKSISELINFANKNSITAMELCLSYANSIPWASGIVIGVASVDQLRQIHQSSSSLPLDWASAISILPPEVVDPRRWKL